MSKTRHPPLNISSEHVMCMLMANLQEMTILRSWREQKVMLKWRFPILCDEDFAFEKEDRESMLTKLGNKLNKTRAELESLFMEIQLY